MEAVNRFAGSLMKATSSNAFIDVCLVGSFMALCYRSMEQQKEIQAMDEERKSLLLSNKAMKKVMWDWKQQLYAEAANPETAVVPLSRLRLIYGEAPLSAPRSDDATKGEAAKAPPPKFVV